jgi:glutathione synthase/RimK-type ligase-like ATP-grasp enzyme
MAVGETGKLALLWRGDRRARSEATAQNNRLSRVFEALAALGIHAEPAVYSDEIADEVREQLLKLDGVLVWVDPLSDGQRRTQLDAILRDVATRGVWVSAHPDVTLKMGVKEVLHRTRHLGWGADTHLYRTAAALQEELLRRLQSSGPRVLKQNRGNGGQGVWKVELISSPEQDGTTARVLHARRGSVAEDMPLDAFQPFQPRRADDPLFRPCF